MIAWFKKVARLISLLPTYFFFLFALFFGLSIIVIFLELLTFSFLMPLLTMLSNNSFDSSNFPSVVNNFNDFFLRNFSINILGNMVNLTYAIFVIVLTKVTIQFLNIWVSSKISLKAQHFYSLKLYNSYLNRDYAFHVKKGSSELFRNIIFEVNNFSSVLSQGLSVLLEIGVLLAIFIFSYNLQPKILFVILMMFLIVSILFLITKTLIKRQGNVRILWEHRRLATVQNSFDSIKDIIVYNLSKLFYNSFDVKNRIITNANFIISVLSSIPRLLLELSAVLVLLVSVMFFSNSANNGGFEMIGLFLIVAFRSLPAVAKIASTLQTFVFLKPSVDVVSKEFFENYKETKKNKVYEKLKFNKEIVFSNVGYSHENKIELLKKLNFKIKKGSRLGIIGESGHGKSTMINLILGLLVPTKGKVLIDDQILNKNNMHQWRKNISYAGQKIALLNSGVIENIILDRKYEKDKFNKIIKACALENFVKKRLSDKNLKINIALKISGGEAQRLGIARALYNDTNVLIFDESTSAIDKKNEQKILKFIYSKKSITVLFIAHNMSSLFGCDKIINFYEKGKAKIENNRFRI